MSPRALATLLLSAAALLSGPAAADSCVQAIEDVDDGGGLYDPNMGEQDACRVLANLLLEELAERPYFLLRVGDLQPTFPTVGGAVRSTSQLDSAPSFRPVPLIGTSGGVGLVADPPGDSDAEAPQVEVPVSFSFNPLGLAAAVGGEPAAIARLTRFWDISVIVPVRLAEGAIAKGRLGFDTRIDIAGLIEGGRLPQVAMAQFQEWLTSKGEAIHALAGVLGATQDKAVCVAGLRGAENLGDFEDRLHSWCGIANALRATESIRRTFAESEAFARSVREITLGSEQHSGGVDVAVDLRPVPEGVDGPAAVSFRLEGGYRWTLSPLKPGATAGEAGRRVLPGFSFRAGYIQREEVTVDVRGAKRGFAAAVSGLVQVNLGREHRTRLHVSAGAGLQAGEASAEVAAAGLESGNALDLRLGIALSTPAIPAVGLSLGVPITDFGGAGDRAVSLGLLVDWVGFVGR